MRKACLLTLLVGCVMSTSAIAQPKEETQEPAATTAPDAVAEEAPAPEGEKPKAKDNRRPYTSTKFDMENMSEIEIESYGRIKTIRKDSIDKMKQLVESTPNYPNIASVYYRIAEYTMENIKYDLALKAQQYRRDVERFKRGELKERPEPPAKDYSPTLPYYEKILMEHPDYPRVEEVLFYLGRNGLETGKALGDEKLSERSIKYINKLAKLFPQSQFLPNGYLLAAEYYFEKNNLFEALKYYKKLVDEYKDAPMYLYALYKEGWVYYNYQQYDKTLTAFEEVITALREKGEEDATLRQMTFKDYIITVSEAGNGWSTAGDYLKQEYGEEKANEALHTIAQMLVTHGFYDDSISLNMHFIELDKKSPKALGYWNSILKIYRDNFPFDETEKQIRMARLFFRNDGAWVAANSGNTEVMAKAEDFIIKWDLALAEHYLAEGLYFDKGDEAFLMAINRFRDILNTGAGNRIEQAWAGILMAHVGLIRSNSGGKIIFVAENVLGPAYPGDYKLPRKIKEQSLNEFEQGFLDALVEYEKIPNRAGQKPDLKPLAKVNMEADFFYVAALVNYMKGHSTKGLEYIDQLVTYKPDSPFLGWAGDMIYEMSARAEDWTGLQRRVNAMLKVGNTEITAKEQLNLYLCDGLINEGVALGKAGNFGDGSERLSTAAQTCSEDADKAGEALYKLGQVAEQGGFYPQAREAYKRVIDEFGRSKYRNMAQRQFAKIKNK